MTSDLKLNTSIAQSITHLNSAVTETSQATPLVTFPAVVPTESVPLTEKKVTALHPVNETEAEEKLALALEYINKKKGDEALATLKQCLALKPHSFSLLTRCGEACMKLHRYQLVIDTLELIPAEEREFATNLRIAKCYCHLYQLKKSREILESLEKKQPQHPDILLHYGYIYLKLADDHKVVKYCDQILEKNPDCVDALILKASSILHMRDKTLTPKALKLVNQALALSPNNVYGLIVRASCAWKEGSKRDTQWINAYKKEVKPFLIKALELDPWCPAVLSSWGDLYAIDNRNVKAMEFLNRCLEIFPCSTEAHYKIGEIHMSKDEFDLAEHHFKTLVHINPEGYFGWDILSALYTYRQIKSHSQSEKDAFTIKIIQFTTFALARCKDRIPLSLMLRRRIPCCEHFPDLNDNMIKDYDHLIKLIPEQLKIIEYNKAQLLFVKYREWEKAIHCYSAAIENKILHLADILQNGKIASDDVFNTHALRGMAYYENKQYEEAEKDFDIAWEKEGLKLQIKFLHYYIRILKSNKDWLKGYKLCQKIIELKLPEEFKEFFNSCLTFFAALKQENEPGLSVQPENKQAELKPLLENIIEVQEDPEEALKERLAKEERFLASQHEQKLEEIRIRKEKAALREPRISKNELKKQEIERKLQEKRHPINQVGALEIGAEPTPIQILPVDAVEEQIMESEPIANPEPTAESPRAFEVVPKPIEMPTNLDNFRVYIKPKENNVVIERKKIRRHLPQIESGSKLELYLSKARTHWISLEDIISRMDKQVYACQSDPKDQLIVFYGLSYHLLKLTEALSAENFPVFKNYLVDPNQIRYVRNDLRSYFPFLTFERLTKFIRKLLSFELGHNFEILLTGKGDIESFKNPINELDLGMICTNLEKKAWDDLIEHNAEYVCFQLFRIMDENLDHLCQLSHVKEEFLLFWREGDDVASGYKMIVSNLRKCLVLFRGYKLLHYFNVDETAEINPKLKHVLEQLIPVGNIIGHEFGEDLASYQEDVSAYQVFEVSKIAKEMRYLFSEVHKTKFSKLLPLSSDSKDSFSLQVRLEQVFPTSIRQLLIKKLNALHQLLPLLDQNNTLSFGYAKLILDDLTKSLWPLSVHSKFKMVKLLEQNIEGFHLDQLKLLGEDKESIHAYILRIAHKAETLIKLFKDSSFMMMHLQSS